MVVNIGTKTLTPGQTYVFDSVERRFKRVFFRILVGIVPESNVRDIRLSFTDTFSDYFTFSERSPVFEMSSDIGTYEGKIFVKNQGTLTNHTITYIEILQP